MAGHPVPRLIPALDGSTLISRDNKYYAVFEYLEGYNPLHSFFFRSPQSSQILGSVGKTLGRLHILMKDFRSNKCTREREAFRMGKHYRGTSWYWKCLEFCRGKLGGFGQSGFSKLGKRQDQLKLDIDITKSALTYTSELLEHAKLDKLHIHGDFGLTNILMRKGAPLFVVDFELSHMDWKLIDLAYFLNDFAYYNRYFNRSAENKFLEEYNKFYPITDEESKVFPFIRLHSILQRLTSYAYMYYKNGKRREYKISRGQRSMAKMLVSHLPELSDIRITAEDIPHKFFPLKWSKNRKAGYSAPSKNPIH